jgi:CheY-like chemotaxis protein
MPRRGCADPARLLIVDDNPSIHNDVRKILCSDPADDTLRAMEAALFDELPDERPGASFRVDSANHGEDGVEMARQAIDEGDPYLLAVVDMRMPGGWDGLETIEHLWQVDHHVQTLICTAYSDYTWPEICQRLGNADRLRMIKKPFGSQEFLELIEKLVDKAVKSQPESE